MSGPPLTTVELFLIAMAVIFFVPSAIWRLGRTDYWAPLVVVQIVTGILLVIGMVGGYWIGTSFSSARKTEIAANERQS